MENRCACEEWTSTAGGKTRLFVFVTSTLRITHYIDYSIESFA